MTRTIIIVVLALLGIFVHPFSPGTIDFLYRFVIFSALTYLVYISLRSGEEEQVSPEPIQTYSPPPPRQDLEVKLKENIYLTNLLENDARTEIYIKSQFEIMKSILVAENGWIFYKNNPESIKKIYLESVPELTLNTTEDIYDISGLIQILDSDDKILIENNINEENRFFNYYSDTEYRPASFLGIPITLNEHERLFYVFDSANTEHFNHDDKTILDLIRENIKIFIINRLKGYSLLASLKAKDRLLEFATKLNGSKTISIAIGKLAEHLSSDFEATRLTISIKKTDSDLAVIRRVIGQKNDYDENFEFSLEQGLTGWVIGKNKPYLIEDLEKGEYFIPRYSKEEKSNFGLRSFLGVPIEAESKVYGAVTLEHTLPGKYTEGDKRRISDLITIFSTTFLRQQS